MGTNQILLGVDNAAGQLGIGRSKLYELIAAGSIKTVKIGRRTLIAAEECQRFARELIDAAESR